MRSYFSGRTETGGNRGTVGDLYKRFAKAGVPGFSLEEAERDPLDAVPEPFQHLIAWYHDIRARAPRGQYFEPITLAEIEAYQRKLARIGIEMEPLDEDLLCRMDTLWMEAVPPIDAPKPPPQQQGRKVGTRH